MNIQTAPPSSAAYRYEATHYPKRVHAAPVKPAETTQQPAPSVEALPVPVTDYEFMRQAEAKGRERTENALTMAQETAKQKSAALRAEIDARIARIQQKQREFLDGLADRPNIELC